MKSSVCSKANDSTLQKSPTISNGQVQLLRSYPHAPKQSQTLNPDKTQWDGAVIRFPQPLKYNECAVVNVKTENDDYDNTAQPHLLSKLEAPIDVITFRVLLSYKPNCFNTPAKLLRKRIGTEIDGGYETLESVPFDREHKLYYHCLINSESGYIYKIEWEK